MAMRFTVLGAKVLGRVVAPGAVALGAASWSAAEYAIHRFVGHGPRRRRVGGLARFSPAGLLAEFNEEHVAHHADPSYFAPASHKALAAGVALTLIGAAGSAVVGPRRGLSFALGFAGAYIGYEIAHNRVHTHAPTGPAGRWRRKHHLYHHHRSPRANHGVTSPVFDRVFETHEPAGTVKVPAWMAPVWMVNESRTAVREAFAGDYELVFSKKARAATGTPERGDHSRA